MDNPGSARIPRAGLRKASEMVLLRVLLVGLVFILGSATLPAESIRGAEDSGFQSALDAWLDGEDEAALEALAALAREDNRAAQIFLAQIEDRLWLHHHVTAKLDRKQKIRLLRNPKGLSGQSWLMSAADDTPLARHLLEAKKQPYENSESGEALLAYGELDAALPLIARAYMGGDALGALELALDDRAIPYSSGMAHRLIRELPLIFKSGGFAADDPRFFELRKRIHLLPADDDAGKILWGAFSMQDVRPGSREFLQVGEKLARVPELKPLVQIFERHCPQNVAGAMAALQKAQSGIPLTLTIFSPFESILSTEQYQSSKRFEADLLRRIDHILHKDALANLDACAFHVISESRS